jgi:hypothetical protein
MDGIRNFVFYQTRNNCGLYDVLKNLERKYPFFYAYHNGCIKKVDPTVTDKGFNYLEGSPHQINENEKFEVDLSLKMTFVCKWEGDKFKNQSKETQTIIAEILGFSCKECLYYNLAVKKCSFILTSMRDPDQKCFYENGLFGGFSERP